MFNRRTMLIASGATIATLAAPAIVRAAGPIKMRLSHGANERHPGHLCTVYFKEELERLTNGAVEVAIFPNRVLGTDTQNMENIVAGTIELTQVSGILVGAVTGRVAMDAFQLPFLIRDYDHFARIATSPIAQRIFDDMSEAGVVGLQAIDIGQRHFLSVKEPVKKTAAFAGLKTRILGVPLHKAVWEAVGTNPIGLPYPEVYGALETGVIDAVEINVSSVVGENLWEVGKYLTLTGHYPWHSMTLVNKPFFDGLPADIQTAMREAGRLATPRSLATTAQQDKEGREDLVNNKGLTISQIEDLDEMKKRVQPVLDEWAQKSPLIAEFIQVAQST